MFLSIKKEAIRTFFGLRVRNDESSGAAGNIVTRYSVRVEAEQSIVR